MSSQTYTHFMQKHQELLSCYSDSMSPYVFKRLEPLDQRDFCYSERVRIEEQLIKNKISVNDLIAAARSGQ